MKPPKHRMALARDLLVGRLITTVGWLLVIIAALGFWGGYTSLDLPVESWYRLAAAVLMISIPGALLVLRGRRRARLIRAFRRYSKHLSAHPEGEFEPLAQAVGEPLATVVDNLGEMIIRGYFPAAYLDLADRRIVLSSAPEEP